MGMMLIGGAAIPAIQADRIRQARKTGYCSVTLSKSNIKPRQIMTQSALTNALRVMLAIGGSTNALIHIAAIAGRLGYDIDYKKIDKMSRETPVLVDLKPSGKHYMEDLQNAGGMITILRELSPLLDLECLTVSGLTLGEELNKAPPNWKQDVVRSLNNPIFPEGGIAVLTGNLAPDGAIIKQSAANIDLTQHEGRAIVFDGLEDLANRIDLPDLDVEPDDILVLKNVGPKGAPGMPEAGYIPIPRKLAQQGVKDMVRISDARMSGTAFGTIVLHVSPEAAIGGCLAIVKTGDRISLDLKERNLNLLLPDKEIKKRLSSWMPKQYDNIRGWKKLFLQHVQQAPKGCDLDFLCAPKTLGSIPN